MWRAGGIRVVQRFCGRGLEQKTDRVLRSYSEASQRKQEALVWRFASSEGNKPGQVTLGRTPSGQDVCLPTDKLVTHAIIVGGSGSGKTRLALSLANQILNNSLLQESVSLGALDAKGELFEEMLRYLYAHLYKLPSAKHDALIRRIVLIDFSNTEQITPYNILARRADNSDELLVADRLDTMSEQFTGLSEMSVRMRLIAQYVFSLMVEFEIPLTFFERLFTAPLLLHALVEKSENPRVRDYFEHRFADENETTILALRQRIDSLLLSESVRLSLSASSSPDFAALQDKGAIVLINTAGRDITRGTSKLLQSVVLSDIKQSVFRRSSPQQKFLWFFDEAQEIFKNQMNAEHMVDLLTMARSFGSFFVLLTQSLSSAIRNRDVLNSIISNIRWCVMCRSSLRDASIIAPGISVTRILPKPKRHPYEPVRYMTEREEIQARLTEIATLPDREACLWLKGELVPTMRIRTPYVPPPHKVAGCSEEELAAFIKETPIGRGIPRAVCLGQIDSQERRLRSLIRPREPVSLPAPAHTARAKTNSLLKVLEEEYAKKKPVREEV